MIEVLAAMVAAVAVFVFAFSAIGLRSPEGRVARARAAALERQVLGPQSGGGRGGASALRDDSLSGNEAADRVLQRFDWSSRTAELLTRADLPLKVSEYLLIQVSAFVLVTVLATLASGIIPIGLLFGIGAWLAVRTWVSSRARRRLRDFDKQLPTALSLMATSIRSGFSIMEAIRTVAKEMDRPVSAEFNTLLDETRVGGTLEDSLTRLVERTRSADMRIVARALQIHRNVGGDLASILDSVARTMREREELRGHVLALTAQQRFAGIIIGLLPIWVVGFLSVANTEFIAPLWEEPLGRLLLGIGVTMELLAFFIMRRVLTVEV